MYDGRETLQQFPGGGIFGGPGFGIGAIAPGSGGFAGGFAGVPGVGITGVGTLLTVESAFGVGVKASDIADAIRQAQQEGRFEAEDGQPTIVIAEGPDLTLVLNTARGLFEIFRRSDGAKVGGGVTPEAAIRAVEAGALRPGAGTSFLQAPAPTLAGPTGGGDFNELLRTILGALGQLTGRRGVPRGLEPVAIGGTVNVPVVRGSTADPTGTLRPTVQPLPGRPRLTPLEELRRQATQPQPPPGPPARGPALTGVAQDLLRILLQIRAERALKDAQRRQRELIAQQLAAIRRIQMGFGQDGLGLGLQSDRRNGTTTQQAGVGGGLLDLLISTAGSVGGDLLENLLLRVTRDPARREITVPNGNGEVEELLKQLGAGGDAATQCGLFRGSAGVRMSSRPASVVCLRDPVTGEARFFGHLGRPLVFQRDVTMAKNIPKLIRKLGGHSGHSKR